jgi:anaerobic selenocysteine-containing dehydrogenase
MTTGVILTTCPRDCYDSCGIAIRVRDGRIDQVRGDPAHPMSRGALCVKCSAGYNNEWLDPKVRLTRPLRRVGPKGSGQLAPVSWGEAIGSIADRLGRVASTSGPHTIINAHYSGTLSLLAYFFPMRFFHRLGATDVVPDSICNLAGHVALPYVYGTSFEGFDPFAALAARGSVPVSAEPLMQFADLTFPTPSGRIEIASARAEADGHSRVPLPLADPRPEGGRLRLLSPASTFTLNDSFANVAKLARQAGPPTVALHPADAAARGLSEGDEALLANETGSLKLRVRLSDDVPPGVALSHKGRWPKQERAAANVNALNPGRKADMGENSCVHSVEVAVTRLT